MDDDDLSFNFSSRSVEENLWSNPAPSCALARAADKMTSEAGAPRKKERDMPTKHAREDKAKLPERTAVQAAAQSALPPKKEARVKAPRASDSIADDPNRYHAKPGALEGEAVLKRPLESSSTAVSAIFSRTPFAALPLNEKLVELLESPDKDRAGAVKISNADTKRGDVVNGLGLKTCTNVQGVIVPLLHKNRVNVLVKSQTGSGKTLAYLLPVLNDLMTQPRRLERAEGTRALIIAPTRELCGQITDVLNKLTKCCVWVVAGSITGGEKRKSEKARLRKGVTVLVCTPGRLLDHLKTTESFNLSSLRWIVLDEADRLLDMGFEQTILESLSIIRGTSLPGLRGDESTLHHHNKGAATNLQQKWTAHTAALAKRCVHLEHLVHIMASATLTNAVKQLAMPVMGGGRFVVIDEDRKSVDNIDYPSDLTALMAQRQGKNNGDGTISFTGDINMHDDDTVARKRARVTLDKDEAMDAPAQLAQYYMMVTCKWRLAALLSFLRAHSHQKVIVFFVTCDSVDYHALLMREVRWPEALDEALPEDAGAAGREGSDDRIEPLEASFSGIFGNNCPFFRLHGNVPQKVRQAVYKEFCSAERGILFCTDVAARGLDLPRVDWILQYDPPCDTTDYLHRIGRTARRGLGGSALLFLLPSEGQYVQLLCSHNLYPEQLSLQAMFADVTREIPGSSKFKNSDEMAAVILQRRIETVVFHSKHLQGAARQGFRSFLRAYTTHSADAKGIFQLPLLHLGHVAKSFGLRENPKSIRAEEDVIGKIFNGEYSAANVDNSKDSEKKRRDDKYALARLAKKDPNKRNTSKEDEGCSSSGEVGRIKKKAGDKQVIRKMSSKSLGGLTVSGKFRKAKDGYFRKKLKEQSTSEFAGV